MSTDPIILFDLPTKEPVTTWSLNPWKTRMLFNYKGLNYKTEWLEYPDVRPRLEPHVPPSPVWPTYSIPTVQFPDGKYIMDSKAIVEAIEKEHPTPSVHLDSPLLPQIERILKEAMPVLGPFYLTLVPKKLLGERCITFWHKTRTEMVGMSLDQYAKENPLNQVAPKVASQLKEATQLLTSDPSGPFFMGTEVSYTDFVWGGFLLFFKALGDEAIDPVMEVAGNREAHENLLKALEPWTSRNNY